jgi:hypothetical protein
MNTNDEPQIEARTNSPISCGAVMRIVRIPDVLVGLLFRRYPVAPPGSSPVSR